MSCSRKFELRRRSEFGRHALCQSVLVQHALDVPVAGSAATAGAAGLRYVADGAQIVFDDDGADFFRMNAQTMTQRSRLTSVRTRSREVHGGNFRQAGDSGAIGRWN